MINSVMPKSPLRKSISGEVDCEVILLGDKEYLFTTDDFSSEDLLQEDDPYVLGWNIACGAISDVIAAGGKPLLYSHSMVIPPDWDEQYIREFSTGISTVLQRYSVSFIGGDLGISDNWRYTASVIGVPTGRTVNRKGCQSGDAIFITGKIGAGNLNAVVNLLTDNPDIDRLRRGLKHQFNTHERLPAIISRYASCAIDTSDGVFAALQAIANLNNTGFKVSNLPFDGNVILAADILQVPSLLFFLGGCGEYEILFTISRQNITPLKDELNSLKIDVHELGEITADPNLRTAECNARLYDLHAYDLNARDFTDVKDYVKSMTEWVLSRRKS